MSERSCLSQWHTLLVLYLPLTWSQPLLQRYLVSFSKYWYLETKGQARGVFSATRWFYLYIILCSWKIHALPCLTPHLPQRESDLSLLSSVHVIHTLTLSCVAASLILCSSRWTLSWSKTETMLTSFLNSSVHRPIHWLGIYYVLSCEAWHRVQRWPRSKPSGSAWENWEERVCQEPHSLCSFSPIRGDYTEWKEEKHSQKTRKLDTVESGWQLLFTQSGSKGNPCLVPTGPLGRGEREGEEGEREKEREIGLYPDLRLEGP